MSEVLQGEAVLKTLMLTDLVSSTHLVAKLGDRRTARLFARHDELARDLLAQHSGLEIDKSDGFLLLFDRPLCAVRYALDYHQALAHLAEEMGIELAARIGIHLGEVFLRTNPPEHVERGAKPVEVEGLAKPITARLMAMAAPRQTLLTRGAFELARRAAVDRTAFGDRICWLAHGAYQIQGLRIPVKIFEVGLEGFAPLTPPGDSPKARLAWGEATTLRSGSDPMRFQDTSMTTASPPDLVNQIVRAVEASVRRQVIQGRSKDRPWNRGVARVAALLFFLACIAFEERRIILESARANHEAERARRAEQSLEELSLRLSLSPHPEGAEGSDIPWDQDSPESPALALMEKDSRAGSAQNRARPGSETSQQVIGGG